MRLLETLASAFINTFGITQPTPEARHKAARFIGVLLLIALAAAVTAAAVAFKLVRR